MNQSKSSEWQIFSSQTGEQGTLEGDLRYIFIKTINILSYLSLFSDLNLIFAFLNYLN
jgi:hypothetical protein